MNAAVPLADFPDIVRRPDVPAHFMKLQAVGRRVRVMRGDRLLADSARALRVIEFGRDVFAPVLYLPVEDLAVGTRRREETTHCPLKGDAAYFDLVDADGTAIAEKAAWSYPEPMPNAPMLAGRFAFYTSGLTVVESDVAV